MAVRRGEIYWVDFGGGRGREQSGVRPALVVQNDVGNQFSPTTVVVAITRTIPSRPYPFVVVLPPDDSGLRERSAAHCAQILTIDKDGASSRLRPPTGESEVRPIGRLNGATMAEVDAALRYNLGL